LTRNGTPDAFTALYERHWRDLVAYCRPRLDRPDDAEDAAHEALLRAYRAFPDVQAEDPLWPWLATIAANVCNDMRRRDRRRSTVDASSAVAAGLAPPEPADVHDDARHRLRADLLHRALRRLPPRARRLVVLREYGGWTYEEIARTDGTSVASVRSRLMRHRRRLGHRVEEMARAERQWPLPVGWLRARARLVRDWAERVARTGLAWDSGLLVGLSLGSQVAVAALVGTLWLDGPGLSRPAMASVAASSPRPSPAPGESRRSEPQPPTREPTPRDNSRAPGRAPGPTVTRIGVEGMVPEDSPAGADDTGVQVEDHEDWLEVTVTDPVHTGLLNAEHKYWVSCAKTETRRTACAVAREVLTYVPAE
jgi:RNA polymerase sigma-70 factor (ECF subfamily)